MWIGVVALFPELLHPVIQYGVTGRAVEEGRLQVELFDPRAFTEDRHRAVDDRPYGGGPGMVMKVDPLHRALAEARALNPMARAPRVVALTPQGVPLRQQHLERWRDQTSLVLVAGRYEGIDERLIDLDVDEECSIGDFVLSGGEIAAAAVIDGIGRLIPGVLGHGESARQDSFVDGLLDCPHFTRPEIYAGVRVPPVLLSGDHQRIARWRRQQALGRTWERRPDLLSAVNLSTEDQGLLQAYIDSRSES